jgi:hypothetical protein
MKKIIILVPIYNDWQSVSKLLDEININVKGLDFEFSILLLMMLQQKHNLLQLKI